MSSPCTPNVSGAGNLSDKDSEALLQQLKNRADIRVTRDGVPIQQALKDIAGEIKAEQETMSKIYQRNSLLDIQAKQRMKDFARRFSTVGEGIRAFLEGSRGKIGKLGARLSVDYQSKYNEAKYFGMLISRLEADGVLRDFKHMSPELMQDVYREHAEMTLGQPAKSVTGNDVAFKIAKHVDDVSGEMVARQNRAGSYINRMPGYITRQTHDVSAIRSVGSLGNNAESMNEAYHNWWQFTQPLLDMERTFHGTDPAKVSRNIHEGLYTGIHGPAHDETDLMTMRNFGSLANKISQARVLHFKDADSAFKYNQAFGIREYKEQVLNDLHVRSRQISLLENLGPSYERNFEQVLRELAEESRERDDSSKHVDSLRDWKIRAAFNELTGKNEWTANPTLSKFTNFLKINAQLSKMGAVVLSKSVDMGFIQRELAYQGMSGLEGVVQGLGNMIHRSDDAVKMSRMMGVGMEQAMGNALSRFSEHSTMYGWSHTLQKWFYDMTLLPRWNDSFRMATATVMANHLGQHAHLAFQELPQDLRNMMTMYDIAPSRWDALRNTAYTHNDSHYITPDKVSEIPNETIAKLVEERGLKATDTNIARERDRLETSLGTYFRDRADIAVPTPGIAERKYATWNTQAGTPLGETLRLMMMFKSFPITIMNKVLGREIYGNGSDSLRQWLLHDHQGKFKFAMTMAIMTAAGYVSQSLHDITKGKTPRPLIVDGKVDWNTVQEASVRGGTLGLIGESLFGEFDHNYRSYLQYLAGPTFGQLDQLQQLKQNAEAGKNVKWPATKLTLDNAPFANLFYIRPILDYFVLWNLQEAMSPGSLNRMQSRVETENHQHYFVKPTDTLKKNQ